jgi:hypothetical protein
MGITVAWDNERKTIIRYTYTGQWTWPEFYAAAEQQHCLQDEVKHRVDMIVDTLATSFIPDGLQWQFNRAISLSHPNTGITVIVSDRPLIKSVFYLFCKMYPTAADRYRLVETMEQAQAFLQGRQQESA